MLATFLSLVALSASPDAVELTPGAFAVPTTCGDVIIDFNEDLGEATAWIVDDDGVRLLEGEDCAERAIAAR